MISFLEYIDLIGVLIVAAWTTFQQWKHNRHDARLNAIEKLTVQKDERKVIYDEMDLREQRRIQEEKNKEAIK